MWKRVACPLAGLKHTLGYVPHPHVPYPCIDPCPYPFFYPYIPPCTYPRICMPPMYLTHASTHAPTHVYLYTHPRTYLCTYTPMLCTHLCIYLSTYPCTYPCAYPGISVHSHAVVYCLPICNAPSHWHCNVKLLSATFPKNVMLS